MPELPPHLRDDAPYLQCAKCKRKSWSEAINSYCRMPQPDGERCDGILVPADRKAE